MVPTPVLDHLDRGWRESRGRGSCLGDPMLGRARGVRLPGPNPQQTAPHEGPPPAPLPLPWQEEETWRPSPGLPTAAAASPAPAPPRAAVRTSGIPAPARGEWGRRGGRSSRQGTRCGLGAAHAREELCSEGQEPGRRPPHPKLESNFLVPLRVPRPVSIPVEAGSRGGTVGEGAPVECRQGQEGGDGRRGRNVELSRGTQRGHHGECRTDGWHWPIGARLYAQTRCATNGNQAVGWAGPRLAGPDPRTPSSR